MKYDFGGYATRNDLRCSDGRTIRKDAFKDCDGLVVPLVWNHNHNSIEEVVGHALLENRADGVYTYGSFNETDNGRNAKLAVQHGDVTALSIYANKLKQVANPGGGKDVVHGVIREVSLVLAGANPGAMIDTIAIEHADGSYGEADEGVIYSGEYFELDVEKAEHADDDPEEGELEEIEEVVEDEDLDDDSESDDENVEHADGKDSKVADKQDDRTVQDVLDTLNDEQKTVVEYLIGMAIQDATDGDMKQSFEGDDMAHHNVFEGDAIEDGDYLTHAETMEMFSAVMQDAKGYGSFRDSLLAHAATYGIDNIDVLFPDAQDIRNTPDFIKREMAWVSTVMSGTNHTPFARIRSKVADITADEARARGYVKGRQKVNEVITVAKRETTPQTVYKKQKLDRDDIIDITSFDVVAWLWSEMRIMLDEEIARAILIGDGRESDDNDKIKEDKIRPIVGDNDLFVLKENVSDAAHASAGVLVEEISKSNKDYRGSGNPVFFCSPEVHSDMLWIKDNIGRKIYDTDAELCSALRVKEIVEVPLMSDFIYKYAGVEYWIKGIKVNLVDYSVGTDRGGSISQFEDFDIDYNQQKYLLETRLSGAMTLPQAAQVYRHLVVYTAVEEPDVADIASYYERTGTGTTEDPYVYELTEDTSIDSEKTYYTRS